MIFGTGRPASTRTRREFLAVGAALCALVAGCGGGGSASGGGSNGGGGGGGSKAIFTGVVLDANSGDTPVNGAKVVIAGVTAFTGSDGSFLVKTDPIATATKGSLQGPLDSLGREAYYRSGYHCPAGLGCSLVNLVSPGFDVPATGAGSTRNLGTFKLGNTDGPPFPPNL
ncbi:MAG: hypothetical protein ACKO5K_05505 [Armatimonadota bacterium]